MFETRQALIDNLAATLGPDYMVVEGKTRAEVVVHAPITSNYYRKPVLESLASQTGGVWDRSRKYSSTGHVIVDGFCISVKAKKAGAIAESIPIKPKELGLAGVRMSPTEYVTKTLSGLDAARLDGGLRVYLIGLFLYYAGRGDELTVRLLHKLHKARIPVNEVTNYFGEVMGPLAVRHLGLLQLTTYEIEHPASARQPLMDYALHEDAKTWVVSAKAAKTSTTNTIKPQDIITLLGQTPHQDKWLFTTEYKILMELAAHTPLRGPIAAYRLLHPNAIPGDAFNAMVSASDEIPSMELPGLSVASQTVEGLMLACERYLKQQTRANFLNYTNLLADAIEGNVVYVKFALNKNGFGTWGLVTPDEIRTRAKPVILRGKNSVGRVSDKMGLQV